MSRQALINDNALHFSSAFHVKGAINARGFVSSLKSFYVTKMERASQDGGLN